MLRVRAQESRAQAERIRKIANDLDADADRAMVRLRELEENGAVARQVELGGRDLVTAGIRILEASGREGPIHYKEWFELLRASGYHATGKEGVGTFLAAISHDDRVRSCGSRSGKYELAEPGGG